MQLKNVLGQVIVEEEIESFNGSYTKTFDITKYGKGQYFISFTNDKNEKVEKVIVF